MKYYAITNIGKKYNHNEDAYALPESNKKYNIENPDVKNKGSLFVLCDGIGGLNAGEVASELSSNWIIKDYYSIKDKNIDLISELKKIILSVNTKIKNLANENESYQGMGTTLAAVLILNNKALIFSVGDSRVYVLNENKLKQITEDQSEVWPLYKSGCITKDELRFHPRNNIITMALGINDDIDIQNYEYEFKKGDIFLICSDGLSDMVGDKQIEKILNKGVSLKNLSKNLINTANKNGGKDNITAILIET